MSNMPTADKTSLISIGLSMAFIGCMFGSCVGMWVAYAMLGAIITTPWIGMTVMFGLALVVWVFNFIARVRKLA